MLKEIDDVLNQIKNVKNQNKNFSFGVIIITSNQKSFQNFVLLPIKKINNIICVSITIHKSTILNQLLKNIDGKVDYVIIDSEQKIENFENITSKVLSQIKKSKVLTFKSNDHTANAVDALIHEYSPNTPKKIFIIGIGNLGSKVASRLVERGHIVFISGRNKEKTKKIANAINLLKPKKCTGKIKSVSLTSIPKNCDILAAFTPSIPVITKNMVQNLNKNSLIIDGGIRTIFPDAIKEAYSQGISLVRLDARSGIFSALTLILETSNLVNKQIGKKSFFDQIMVSGGWIGQFGDIIVDNIYCPKQILGFADGKGGSHQKYYDFSKKNMKSIQNDVELFKKNSFV